MDIGTDSVNAGGLPRRDALRRFVRNWLVELLCDVGSEE